MPPRHDPEFAKAIAPLLPMMAAVEKPAVHDVDGRRARLDGMMGPMIAAIPMPSNIEIKVYHTKANDGFSVPIYHFFDKNATAQGPAPAILHTHGGGYIALDVETLKPVLAGFVATSGVQMFSVDYRLAPENPFPIPGEDCYAGLVWLNEHAKEFNIDPARIAIYGESAGGGLAATVAIMARDRQLSPPLAKQVLIYPMLDDRNLKPSPIEDFLFWSSVDNVTGWTAYVGKNAGKEGVSPYAAAARVETVEGLPPTYIDVGSLDLFLGEDIAYAGRLSAASIEVELHVYPGVPHAFELLASGSDVAKKAWANRVKALTTF